MKSKFSSEIEVCAQFIAKLPEGWIAYPETEGWDILLVRDADGTQIGIEAKLTLNAKVLLQAIEGVYSRYFNNRGEPDFRAVLVPSGTAGHELSILAKRLGVTVIEIMSNEANEYAATAEGLRYGLRNYRSNVAFFSPDLPRMDNHWTTEDHWIDRVPYKRHKLPEYVPDVKAGASGPSSLSPWKIKAIKIAITLEKRGYVTIADFKHLDIQRQRWLDMGWIKITDVRGRYQAGNPMGFKRQHPKNYEQIAADYDVWKSPEQLEVPEVIDPSTPNL